MTASRPVTVFALDSDQVRGLDLVRIQEVPQPTVWQGRQELLFSWRMALKVSNALAWALSLQLW
jgi:hypothetical protein